MHFKHRVQKNIYFSGLISGFENSTTQPQKAKNKLSSGPLKSANEFVFSELIDY